MKKEEKLETFKKYPWLDKTDEIIHIYQKKKKKEVMDMLYKYKEAFSLRDEIGTCPKIEVRIDVMDKSPFFIRPYHIREEDKKVIDKEMNHLCYLSILKKGFSPYSSPVMLISRKVMQDRRVVMDFRHLNVRIAKNNLAYPLVRDTFSVLGNFKCEVLSVLDLKDTFHSLRLLEDSKRYCGILPYFGSTYQRMPMGLHTLNSTYNEKKYAEILLRYRWLFVKGDVFIGE